MPEPPFVLRDFQTRILEEAQEKLRQVNSLLITAPTGSGKCLAPGTPVIMYDGSIKPVEDIVPGNRLMGPDSGPRKVLTTTTGHGPMVRITPEYGDPWDCNDAHILTLQTTLTAGTPTNTPHIPKQYIDITVKEYLAKTQRWKDSHRLVRPSQIEFPWESQKTVWHTHPNHRNTSLSPSITAILLTHGPLDPHLPSNSPSTHTPPPNALPAHRQPPRHPLTKFTDPEALELIAYDCEAMGLNSTRPENWSIPHHYKTMEPHHRLLLLASLIDASGQAGENQHEFVSISENLAQDTAFIARSLGMPATLSQQRNSHQTYWQVSIAATIHGLPTLHLPNREIHHHPTPDHLQTAFTVTPIGLGPYHGFTLNGDRHFLLGDFTITHNTVIAAEIIARARRRNLTAALLVHREELIYQSIDKLTRQLGEPPGLVWKNSRDWDHKALVIAQNTANAGGIPDSFRGIDILIIDEAHHTVAPTWLETIDMIHPRYLLGLSATPFRQDKEPLSPEPFEEVIRPVTPKELIDRGILCPAHIISPIIFSLNGDVQRVSQASNLPHIYLEASQHAIANGRTKILLYVSQTGEHTPIQVMKQTVELMQRHGITASQVNQDLTSRQRRNSINTFINTPGASVLVNYIALTEGTDLPLVDCIIVGRSTQSESTLIQMIGRGLRLHPQKKDCLVLDYSGRPDMDSIIHYWRLDEPREMGASQARQPPQRNKAELEELTIRFPGRISPMGSNQIEYPWFRPFEDRQLLALPLWNNQGQAGRYVTAEPTKDGTWRVTVITLENSGPAPITKQQAGGLSEAEAVTQIRSLLGDKAPYLQRNAPWRMKPATDQLRRTWEALKPQEGQMQLPLAGDMSDAVARERFRRRVHQLVL